LFPLGAGKSLLLACCTLIASLCLAWHVTGSSVSAQDVDYISDRAVEVSLTHRQDWGDFGLNTAAARSGATGSPMQIGEKLYAKGLGHHANGEIAIELRGQYTAFRTWIGVQWQGGNRGSVTFRIAVDGKTVFEAGPLSDSDPPKQVEVPVVGARELRLIAGDSGDGIGCDMANWAEACLVRDSRVPFFGTAAVALDGVETPRSRTAAGGMSLIARSTGPQVAWLEPARMWTVSADRGEQVRLAIPVRNVNEPMRVSATVSVVRGTRAEVELSLGDKRVVRQIAHGETMVLATEAWADGDTQIEALTRGVDAETGVRWSRLRCLWGEQTFDMPLAMSETPEVFPPPELPAWRPALEQELIEWDWRMQDGIGTSREGRSWAEAVATTLDRGDQLMGHLAATGVSLGDLSGDWEQLRLRHQSLSAASETPDADWESLWRGVHTARRQMAFRNPLAQVGPLLFVKHVPSSFSHQLTQYSGRNARPGGGIFVLDAPGESMRCRQLGALPLGNYMAPDISWDGRRVLFSFCETEPGAIDWRTNESQFYRLYEMAADGSDLRQLTDQAYDDFSPRYLPNGKILFLSTRRGGFHRCGRGPCPVHAMATANADGSDVRLISFHETHEWDPAVLNDGRVIYTRWDYVDRHAVFYQQLWSVRPDGSDVRAFYGNNTLNPVGVWEARPVPRSNRVMATAAAHHAMTAGSIILLDVARGIDGLEPITRLTPDVLFPESESPVGHWYAPAGVSQRPPVSPEEKRWPGHCYRTPYPLSEDVFLAAYSFEPLIGEPHANRANMFGIYLVDRFGNKELLYRDLNIGSLWPMPLRARPRPPALPSMLAETEPGEGTFFMQNVYDSWPQLSASTEPIHALRIVQVLPKTTPHANTPRVGLANASPGKQVLGTVPVEPDGSAYFRAPAEIGLAFQALDDRGMAVQTMRSLTYLQPGEHASCVGCHEHRTTAPITRGVTLAGQRPPSAIEPGPDGSKPFSYAILVQPILDKHCVQCHSPADAQGGIDLTGAPAGEFTVSYKALAPRVSYSEWKGTPQANFEPLTHPDQFGARASPLMALLLKGHEKVTLSDEELRCLATWMDANALFYGTFDPEDQKRQQRGERIAGPALE
jgi:hypothetical protein